ncbi:unnamed protein product [Bacillus thuringiensis DB27]|uniref:Plasmid recombination enzyme n=1 Tax=Bacillus thuringiensis DB27 TaxID=1431339 RepID=W8XWQ6_BACTU|nr:unnamed protein product [Bacillus thuringiensis DB27]
MLFSISFNQSHQSSLSHNNRENVHGNPGIDLTRLHENIYFVQKNIRSVYKDVFQEAVDKYNEKQKRNDRKIQDYYDKIKKDTKTHEQRELVVAIGEGKDDSKYRKTKKEALKEYAEAFQGRNPNLAVYNMVLHDDEANPHLHINYVPNFESSRGLTRRVGMDRALQQQGIKGKGMELIANWRQLETAYIESLAKEHIPEFERANVGSHKYMKVRQYKEYAEVKSIVEKQIGLTIPFRENCTFRHNLDTFLPIPYLHRESVMGVSIYFLHILFAKVLNDESMSFAVHSRYNRLLMQYVPNLMEKCVAHILLEFPFLEIVIIQSLFQYTLYSK